MKRILSPFLLLIVIGLTACAGPEPYDYSAFKQAKPESILVLPPSNQSPDINASYSMLSQVTYPLAESGYYVFPVAVVDEVFRQNGMTTPEDIHNVPLDKLYKIFGADAVLYIDVAEYGTSYKVISSDTRVTANAELIDIRTGQKLWSGSATASSTEQNSSSSSLLVMMVQAVIEQVANTLSDKGHEVSGVTSARLLTAGTPNGILFGPYSPHPSL